MNGIIVVNKPSGITSYDVIRFFKRKYNLKEKIGHTGTLDPLAQGVLIVCIGKATRLAPLLMGMEKEYVAKMLLGKKTDTDDIDGKVVEENPVCVEESQVKEVVMGFKGEIEQIPPIVSAIKHKGKPLYKHYRKGVIVAPSPRKVFIKEISLLNIQIPYIQFRVVCSKGTYIRALCRDIGNKLGCGGTQTELKRTKVGNFLIEDSYTLEEIETIGLEKVFIEMEKL